MEDIPNDCAAEQPPTQALVTLLATQFATATAANATAATPTAATPTAATAALAIAARTTEAAPATPALAAAAAVSAAYPHPVYTPTMSPCSSLTGTGLHLVRILSKQSAAQFATNENHLDFAQRESSKDSTWSCGASGTHRPFGASGSQRWFEQDGSASISSCFSFDVPWWLRWQTPSEGGGSRLPSKKRMKKEADARAFQHLTSFEGCPELLRGTPLHVVMRRQAAILQDSSGTDETWKLSKTVSGRLNAFISHNWSVPRRKKFLCLALHFNIRSAVIVAGVYLLLVTLLHGWGIIPLVEVNGHPIGFAGRVFTIPIFLLVLLFMRDVAPGLSLQPDVFLDKTCINQTDEALQRRGILKLGAFLHHSDELLICYSDVYLSKLWTIFELGCFYCVGQRRNITVIPASVPGSLVTCLCLAYPWQLVVLFMRGHFEITMILSYLVWSCCLYVTALYFHEIEKGKERMRDTLANFSIRNSYCSRQSDRPIVYSCIASLLRSTGRVDEFATQGEALDAFDEIVRKEVPGLFGDCLQTMGTKPRNIMVCMLLAVLPYAADAAGNIQSGMKWNQWVCQHLLVRLAHGGCALPLTMILLWIAANRLTTVTGTAKHLGCFAATICPNLFAHFSMFFLEALAKAGDSGFHVAIYVAGYIVIQLAVCVLLAYLPSWLQSKTVAVWEPNLKHQDSPDSVV